MQYLLQQNAAHILSVIMPVIQKSQPHDFANFKAEYLKEFTPAIKNGSVSFLSVMRFDLLAKVASQPNIFLPGFAANASDYYKKYPQLLQAKKDLFRFTLWSVSKGRYDLTPQLAKGVTDKKSLYTYLKMINEKQGLLAKNTASRGLLIYPGTFDPMHYGHRAMIASLLEGLEPTIHLAVNINSYQARKPNLEATYERRLADLEHRTLRSSILDPYRVCAMDFRFGAKESEDHIRQTRLQSYMAGDSRLRWVIGGDKFLTEVERQKKEEAQGVIGRTLSRFRLKDMTIYIVPRKGQDRRQLKGLAEQLSQTYPAEFVYIDEREYEGRPISSTLIRTYLKKNDTQLKTEATRMESLDLTREYNV